LQVHKTKTYVSKPYTTCIPISALYTSLEAKRKHPSRENTCYVIVIDWVSRNYGSKRTESEGAAQGRGLFT